MFKFTNLWIYDPNKFWILREDGAIFVYYAPQELWSLVTLGPQQVHPPLGN